MSDDYSVYKKGLKSRDNINQILEAAEDPAYGNLFIAFAKYNNGLGEKPHRPEPGGV